ncbi:hypothetical protein CRUP_032239 [Coryphaenoides rupestris]|nr:hypothetical protein CRUP_032239 [Coryphaenoides rupestris]
MSEAPFRAPRRRPLVHDASCARLPVPRGAAEATRCAERVLRADLVQQHVLVLDPAHSQLLYGQGYFGKGILSRGCPGYRLSLHWREFKGQQIPVISQARYEQLLSWRRTFLLNQGLDKEAVNQILVRLSEPIKLATEGAGPGQTEDSSHRKRKRSSPNEQRFTAPATVADSRHLLDSSPMVDPSPLDDPAPMADSSLEYVLVVGDREEEEEEGEAREVTSDPTRHGEVNSDPGRHGEVTSDPGRHGEAFFLVYALGRLSVHHNQKPLSISEVWRRFRGLQPGFESSYAAYHHYRSRGWVPKTVIRWWWSG